jgi:hypothetical protein
MGHISYIFGMCFGPKNQNSTWDCKFKTYLELDTHIKFTHYYDQIIKLNMRLQLFKKKPRISCTCCALPYRHLHLSMATHLNKIMSRYPKWCINPNTKKTHLQTTNYKNPSRKHIKTWNRTKYAKWKLWKHITTAKKKYIFQKFQITMWIN